MPVQFSRERAENAPPLTLSSREFNKALADQALGLPSPGRGAPVADGVQPAKSGAAQLLEDAHASAMRGDVQPLTRAKPAWRSPRHTPPLGGAPGWRARADGPHATTTSTPTSAMRTREPSALATGAARPLVLPPDALGSRARKENVHDVAAHLAGTLDKQMATLDTSLAQLLREARAEHHDAVRDAATGTRRKLTGPNAKKDAVPPLRLPLSLVPEDATGRANTTRGRIQQWAGGPGVGAIEPDGLPVVAELRWVHKLVRFVEEVPIPGTEGVDDPFAKTTDDDADNPRVDDRDDDDKAAASLQPAPPSSSSAPTRAGPLQSRLLPGRAVERGTRSMFHRTVFPSSAPRSTKEDALNLERWLSAMLEELGVVLPQVGSDQTLRERCEAALWLYELALGEVVRQVSFHSKVHANLLQVVMVHFRKLVELHCGLLYEGDISMLLDRQESLHTSMDDARSKLEAASADLTQRDLSKVESEKRSATLRDRLTMQIAHRDRDIDSLKAAVRDAESKHLGEMELRLNAERMASELREELLRREKEMENARALADAASERMAAMEEENARLRRELEAKNTLVEDGRASNASLQQRLANAEIALNDLRARMLEQVSLKEATMEEVSRRRAEMERMQAQIEMLLSRVTTLEDELSDERDRHERLKDDYAALQRAKEAVDKHLEDLSAKHKKVAFRLERTEESLVKERKDGKGFKSRTEELLTRLTNEVRKHEESEDRLSKTSASDRSLMMKYRQEVEEMGQLLRPMRSDLMGTAPPPDTEETRRQWEKLGRGGMSQTTVMLAVRRIGEMKTNLDTATREKEAWRQRFEKADEERKQFERKSSDFEAKFDNASREVTRVSHALDGKSRKLDAEIAQRRSLVTDLEATTMRAMRAEGELKGMQSLQDELDKVRGEHSDMTTKLYKSQRMEENAERAAKHATDRAEQAELQRDSVTAEIKAMRETVDVAEMEAREARDKAHELHAKVADMDTTIALLKEQNKNMAEEYEGHEGDMKGEIERLSRELAKSMGETELAKDRLAKVSHGYQIARWVLQGVAYDENFYERHDKASLKDDVSEDVMARSARRLLEEDETVATAAGAMSDEIKRQSDGQPYAPPHLQKAKIALLLATNMILRKQKAQMHQQHMESESLWLASVTSQEKKMYTDLLNPVHADSVSQTIQEVQHLREEVVSAIEDSTEIWERSKQVTEIAKFWQEKFENRTDDTTQTGDVAVETWLAFAKDSLPENLSEESKSAKMRVNVRRVIAKVYTCFIKRGVNTPLDERASGPDFYEGVRRVDTVFDALNQIMIKGYGTVFEGAVTGGALGEGQRIEQTTDEYLRGCIAIFLAVCKEHQHDPMVATFSRFCGIMPGYLSASTFHFFTDVLDMIRKVVGVQKDWEDMLSEWETGAGNVPVHICHVVLANLFNEQDVSALDVKIRRLFAPDRLRKGMVGDHCVDMDGLMAVLLKEFHANKCPCNPMAVPRLDIANVRDSAASAPPVSSTRARRGSIQEDSQLASPRDTHSLAGSEGGISMASFGTGGPPQGRASEPVPAQGEVM